MKDLGEHIKDFDYDKKRHLILMLACVGIFVSFVFVATLTFGIQINTWWAWLTSILLFVACCVYGLLIVLIRKDKPKYLLYENYLIIKSISHTTYIKRSEIVNISIHRSWIDKLFKFNSFGTVKIVEKNSRQSYMLFVDAENIKNDILTNKEI